MSDSLPYSKEIHIPNLTDDVRDDRTTGFVESYEQAQNFKYDGIWRQLERITVMEGLNNWLSTLPPLTRKNYACAFKRLIEVRLVSINSTLQKFSLVNHEAVIDDIKNCAPWSEATRQARAAAYISFTAFLQRRTQGVIRKAVPGKEGVSKTFFKVREKVKTMPLSKEQTASFFRELEKLNERDALIAKLILQGGKRKEEALTLRIENIDFHNNRISFVQSKTRGTEKITIINYPSPVMDQLRAYVGNRSGLAFVTRNGNKISATQIDRNFIKAGEKASIPFRVTPHVLRVTLVTRLKELNIQDTDIMKITGHANPAQLSSYDRTDPANNATLHHSFI